MILLFDQGSYCNSHFFWKTIPFQKSSIKIQFSNIIFNIPPIHYKIHHIILLFGKLVNLLCFLEYIFLEQNSATKFLGVSLLEYFLLVVIVSEVDFERTVISYAWTIIFSYGEICLNTKFVSFTPHSKVLLPITPIYIFLQIQPKI